MFTHFGLPASAAMLNASISSTKTPFAVLCASAYAVTDEIHQIFVAGRACKIQDWAIDTAGALLGALILFALLSVISKAKKKKAAQIKN